jgi:hypothetical protein
MLNDIYVDKIKIVKVIRGNLVLENGNIIKRSSAEVEVKCNKCGNLNKLKTLYGGKHSPLNRTHICFSCRSTGDKNPFYGKSHTKEFKDKLSKDRKGLYAGHKNPMYGKNAWKNLSEEKILSLKQNLSTKFSKDKNPFYGKTHSEKTKKTLSIKTKEYFKNNKELCLSRFRKGFENRKFKMTSIERIIKDTLNNLNVTNKYNKILHQQYQYDFLINDNILLEVQGDYWHANPLIYDVENNNPTKKPLNERQKFKINQDKLKNEFAIKYGYKIFYIWETEINNKDFSVLDKIKDYINESTNKI